MLMKLLHDLFITSLFIIFPKAGKNNRSKIEVLEASVSHRRAEASCKDLARVGELGMENWSGVAHRL